MWLKADLLLHIYGPVGLQWDDPDPEVEHVIGQLEMSLYFYNEWAILLWI